MHALKMQCERNYVQHEHCTWDTFSPTLHKQCVHHEMKANVSQMQQWKRVFDNKYQLGCILYTAFNGTSADPGGILCAGLVVSSWIAYEIFESPERCMMNEVACYLYAYRAHWLATGSAKGSGSKWNSAPGQYIIKRNVCTWNLQAFFRCGHGALRGWGRGENRVGETKKGGNGRIGRRFFFLDGWGASKGEQQI